MSYTQSNQDVIAQIQLYKAVLHRKASLLQEINYLKIAKNYRQSNQDFKDLKEFFSMTKTIFKRLSEIRVNIRRIQKLPKKPQDLKLISNILLTCLESQEKLEIPRNIFSMNFRDETHLDELKEKYDSLSSEYEEKISELKNNEPHFTYASDKVQTLEDLEKEIYEYNYRFEELCGGREKFNRFKSQKRIRSKTSLDAIKIFHKLSENGLVLRSKILLKQDFKSSLKIAENEILKLQKKVNIEQENVRFLEYEKQDQSREFQKYELELSEYRKKAYKLELRLQDLSEERQALLDFLCSGKQVKDEEYNEDDTLSLNNWMTSFDSMQKEKDILMQENQKLKERINRLSRSGY